MTVSARRSDGYDGPIEVRLESLPRQEELPPAQARVREAEANLTLQQRLHDLTRGLYSRRAASWEELVQRKQALQSAQEQLARELVAVAPEGFTRARFVTSCSTTCRVRSSSCPSA